jgi:hypothetical protein
MSFEIAYVFAYLLNRTLVLPPITGMAPFYQRLGLFSCLLACLFVYLFVCLFVCLFLFLFLHVDFELLFEERDLRSGVAIMTAKEWDNFPQREAIMKDTVEVLART